VQAKRFGRPDLTIGAPGKTGMVLNPRFVEALMGWPIGWTSCVSVVEELCPNKLLTPSTFCVNG
jgi:hypothetical protein